MALAAGFVAWSGWRQKSDEERGSLIGNMEGARSGFMTYSGLLASGLFLFAILMEGMPAFFLNPCVN